jgi:hypothetical protein
MKKSKIILIIVYVIAGIAVLYFAYGVVKNRYFGPGKNNAETNNGATQNQGAEQTGDLENVNQDNNTSENNVSGADNVRPNIENTDCDNNCAKFKDSPDNFKYCQEACGDRPVTPKESEGQCDNLTGLEKDACWRDLAVSKKDFSFCDKISDTKLQKVCRNRVTEEVLN